MAVGDVLDHPDVSRERFKAARESLSLSLVSVVALTFISFILLREIL